MTITKRNLSRTDINYYNMSVRGLSALSEDELLLAVGEAGLRLLSPRTEQLVGRDLTALQHVLQVAPTRCYYS